jgi:hypothetical protein
MMGTGVVVVCLALLAVAQSKTYLVETSDTAAAAPQVRAASQDKAAPATGKEATKGNSPRRLLLSLSWSGQFRNYNAKGPQTFLRKCSHQIKGR